jgi:hypothetical protein
MRKILVLTTAALLTTGCASTTWVPGPDMSNTDFVYAKYICAQESRVDPVYPPPRDFSQGRTGPGGYRPGALTAGGQAFGAGMAALNQQKKLYNLCMEAQGAVAEDR